MHLRLAFPLAAFGFILSAPVFAQNAPAGALPVPPPGIRSQATGLADPAGPQMKFVTESSRIRAFDASPRGPVRSLFLQNGSVVNLAPDLGRQLSTLAHRGLKIRVSGARSTVNGQAIVLANQITVNSETYTAQPGREADIGLDGGPGAGPRPGPDGGPSMAPPPPPQPDARASGPGGMTGTRRGPGAEPPPPPAAGAVARNGSLRNAPPPPPDRGVRAISPSGPGPRATPPPPAGPLVQPSAGPQSPAQAPDTAMPPPTPPPSL